MTPPLLGALLCALIATAVSADGNGVRGTPTAAARSLPVSLAPSLPAPGLRDELSRALAELEGAPEDWSKESLALLTREATSELGSIAIGVPHRGLLLNAVQLPEGAGYKRTDPDRSFGTLETVVTLSLVLARLHREDPTAPLLYVGQMSAAKGGWLKRHKSHQTGRDVDIGLYYLDGAHWYLPASASNLDVPRTYKLVSSLVETGQVEYIFADRSIIELFREHAGALGLSEAAQQQLFYDRADAPDGVLRHAWGHRTHLHVRLKSLAAEHRGQQLSQRLMALKMIPQRRYY